jgi:hypothetical protein
LVVSEILHPAILDGWWSTAATRRNQRASPGEKEKGRRMVHLERQKIKGNELMKVLATRSGEK